MSARNVRANPDRACSDCGIRRASHFALTIDPKSHFAIGPTGTMEEAMRDPKIPRPRWCEDCALHRNEFHAQDIGKWVWDHEEMRRGVPWDVFTVQAQYGTDPKLVKHPIGSCSAAASAAQRSNPKAPKGPPASFWRGCDRYACCGTYPGECEHPIHDAACRKASYDPDAVCECAGCQRERAWAASRAKSKSVNSRKPSAAELRRIRDAELDEACRNRYPCDGCGARGVPIAPLVSGGPRFCQRCHEAAGQPKAPKANPTAGWHSLIADGKLEAADATFSRFRDTQDGRVEYVNDGIGWRIYRMGKETATAAGRRELGGRFRFIGDAYQYVHKNDRDVCASCGGPTGPGKCGVNWCRARATRPNPALILVTGNPAPGAVEKAWCKFHQRDVYDGRTESFGIIRGMPPFVFALGRCKSLEIDGAARPFTPQPWLVCSPDDESLWIVTKDVMNLGSGAAGRAIEAITYDPPRESGKTPAYYRHEFDKPLPVLTPVGDPHRCRAVLLDGGAYSVSDWIHE